MNTTIHLPLLDQIRIATPCNADWASMSGDDRTRHCGQCDLDVHNISELTRDEAEGVLVKLSEGRVCARFYRRADGTILTKDCPVGLAAARRRVLLATSRIAAAVGLAVLAGAAAKAAQDTRWGNYGWSLRLTNAAPVQWVTWKVQTGWAMVFPSKQIGVSMMGDVAGPLGLPPPVQSARSGPYGPHGWEYRQ